MMPRSPKFCLLFLLLALPPVLPAAEKPDAIVLVIADGLSYELITATRYYSVGGSGRLELEQFPRTAIVRTASGSDLVTDSAAAATAFARGIKADNQVLGMAKADDTSGPPSLLDLAKQAGWSTGVVSDDSVTGATPSAFLVEHRNRTQNDQVAAKILEQFGKRVDIVLGGGLKWFIDQGEGEEIYAGTQRETVLSNQTKLRESNVAHFDSWEIFLQRKPDSRPILGTFAQIEFPYYADGTRTLRLKDLTEQAVGFLREKKAPFLLIVEAALPDKASHKNNAKRAIVEVLEYDATIAWLRANLGPNALILATTDHGTGGLAVNGPGLPSKLKGEVIFGNHPVSGASFLTWASGPGGKHESVNRRTVEGKEEEIPKTAADYTQPALVPAKSAMHTGGDVWLLGQGPGSEKVAGFLENTEIYQIVAEALKR